MNVIIIPDQHGSHAWEKAKDIAKKHPDYYVVGLGDWVDSHKFNPKMHMWVDGNEWPDQGENLRNALDWFREDQEHRFFCIGNHDWSYLSCGYEADNCSGHQNSHAHEIKAILNANRDIIHVGVELDGWVFSHAGFTYTWRSYVIQEFHNMFDKWPEEDNGKLVLWDEHNWSLKFLDDTFRRMSHIRGDPESNPRFDELFDWHGRFSSTGNETMQGQLWIRPDSLLEDALFPKQVVGHTEYCVAEPLKLKSNKCQLLLVDSEDHDLITVFDTENPGDDFISVLEYSRNMKKLNKALNDILSQHISDIDAVNNELMNAGVKKEHLGKYLNILRRFKSFVL